jgi:GGDEF domain-containing protein
MLQIFKIKTVDKNFPLQRLYRSHRNFALRAEEELKRAERYSEFLSLIIIDLKSLKRFSAKGMSKHYKNQKDFFIDLERFIKKSVRETDIVSGFEDDKLGLLLSETPEAGADCLVKRLNESLNYLVSNSFEIPQEWQPCYEILSFPEKEDARERFLSYIQNNFISSQ